MGGLTRGAFIKQYLSLDLDADDGGARDGARDVIVGSSIDRTGYNTASYGMDDTLESWFDWRLMLLITIEMSRRSSFTVGHEIFSNYSCASAEFNMDANEAPDSGSDGLAGRRAIFSLLGVFKSEMAFKDMVYTSERIDSEFPSRDKLNEMVHGEFHRHRPCVRLYNFGHKWGRQTAAFSIGRKALVVTGSVEKADTVAKDLIKASAKIGGMGGICIGSLHHRSSDAGAILDRFRKSQFGILVVVQMCGIGLDIPDIDTIVLWCDVFLGVSRLYQVVERAGRVVAWSHPTLGKQTSDVLQMASMEPGGGKEEGNCDDAGDYRVLSDCVSLADLGGGLAGLAVVSGANVKVKRAKKKPDEMKGDIDGGSSSVVLDVLSPDQIKEMLTAAGVERVKKLSPTERLVGWIDEFTDMAAQLHGMPDGEGKETLEKAMEALGESISRCTKRRAGVELN